MSIDNTEYDAALGDRLAAALRAEASSIQAPPDAWARFQDRERATGEVILEAIPGGRREPITPMTPPERSRRHPWRAPLIAAAAVVAIALATTAIATNGFQGRTDAGPAASGSGSLLSGATVTVPVDASPEIAAVINGKDGGAPASSIMDASTAVSATAGPTVTVTMRFTSAPPEGSLTSRFDFPPGYADNFVKGSTTAPKDEPLRYLSFASAAPRGASFLWGAVGPDVSQLQVVATTPVPAGAGSEATSGSATWVIDSGTGAHAYTPAVAAISVWTDMAYGYHGFALKLPAGSSSVIVHALGTDDQTIQALRLNLPSGEQTDLAPPQASATATLSPASTVTSTATSESPLSTTATGLPDAPSSSAGSPSTQVILPGGNEPGAPFAATYPDRAVTGHGSAVLNGTVELIGQCVAVRRENGSAVTPLFPFTQVGTAHSPAILILKGKSYAAGDAISLSGGQPLSYQGLPSRCPSVTFVVGPQ